MPQSAESLADVFLFELLHVRLLGDLLRLGRKVEGALESRRLAIDLRIVCAFSLPFGDEALHFYEE